MYGNSYLCGRQQPRRQQRVQYDHHYQGTDHYHTDFRDRAVRLPRDVVHSHGGRERHRQYRIYGVGSPVYSGDCLNVTVTNGCTATATYAGDNNHTSSSDIESITITKATATVTVTGFSGTYDGLPHGVVSSSASGVLSESLTGLSIDTTTYRNVPGGSVNWSFTNQNYADQSGSATVSVIKRDLTIAAVTDTKIYDGTTASPARHLSRACRRATQCRH